MGSESMSCSLAKMMKGNQIATVIFFVLSIILLCFQASFAQQRQSHWLIGQWNGQIAGYLPKQNPARTLQVFEVLTDGTVRGRWSITGQSTGEADVSVDGAQVRIMTGADSHVALTRERDDLLVGAFVLKNGRGFSIRLTKSAISQTAQEAWTALEREAREAEVAGKWARASTVYRQASISARDRGQFQRAIDYGSKSLEAAAKAQAPAQEIRAILQLVHAYRRVGQANKARETLQRGIDALGEVPAGNEKIALEAQLYREMGWDLIRTGEYERATQELSRSLKSQDAQIELLGRNPKITRQAIHRFENGKSRTLELLGDAYTGAGKTEPAVKAYERGLETVKGRSLATNAVRIHLSLGQLYSRQSQYSQASENFHKALSLSENSRYSWGVLRASSQIGNLLRRTNRSAEAIPFYEKAITTIELTRAALESEEFRSGFFDNMVNTYANMLRTQVEQKRLGEAFNYNERARSSSPW
jgi:tetratricopeptide (TPR) repeat protein